MLTPYSIGYAVLGDALQNLMPMAALQIGPILLQTRALLGRGTTLTRRGTSKDMISWIRRLSPAPRLS